MLSQFAVIGSPVEHSLSPRIHQAFAEQCGIELCYDKLEVEPPALALAIKNFQARGGLGLNITAPHKVAAWHLVDHMSPRAKVAGSVNTIHFQERGICYGDNTDGLGWLRDWQIHLGWPLAGLKVLLLGAGGAAQGLLPVLLQAGCAEVSLWNRTAARALGLQAQYPGLQIVEDFQGCKPDAIINSVPWTDASLLRGLFKPGQYCYDLMYYPSPTVFCEEALASGVLAVSSGLGMLVEQAAESFYLWHGVRPETRPVLASL